MMATFRGSRYPALMVRLGERRFKFIGGRLSVDEADAAMIEEFAARRPEYGIVRETPKPEPAVAAEEPEADAPTDEPEDDAPVEDVVVTANELRAELAEWELKTTGSKAAMWDRLEEAYVEAELELEAEEDPE